MSLKIIPKLSKEDISITLFVGVAYLSIVGLIIFFREDFKCDHEEKPITEEIKVDRTFRFEITIKDDQVHFSSQEPEK